MADKQGNTAPAEDTMDALSASIDDMGDLNVGDMIDGDEILNIMGKSRQGQCVRVRYWRQCVRVRYWRPSVLRVDYV